MRTKTGSTLLALLTLLAAGLIAGCGDSDDDASSSSSSSSAKVAGNGIDRAFVAGMVPHHESAVEMAQIAESEATSTFVKELAADIKRTQTAEIAQMKRVDADLEEAGIDTGELGVDDHMEGMDTDIASLRGAKPFDDKFIALMVPHHEGALNMAKVEIDKGDNAELKKLAEHIIATQTKEISEMRAHAGGDTGEMDHTEEDGGHSG
ncbi:MAG: DUF305 domain-containing protein [Solirubrobacterales bacterium]|nr:DUF305 domain-containing protein [Solirubrobacterales bacterium]